MGMVPRDAYRHLSDGEQAQIEALRDVLAKHAETLANDEIFPGDVVGSMWRAGLLTAAIPARFGGGGASLTATAGLIETAATESATLGWLLLVQFGLHHLLPTLAGTDAGRYFMAVVDEGALLAGSTNTRALSARRLDDGSAEVSGTVRFASGAPASRWISIPVTFDGSSPGACVMISRDASGVTCRPARYLHSLRGSLTGEIELTKTVVPPEDIHPFIDLMDRSSRPACRYFGAWQSLLLQNAVFLGIARAAIDASLPSLQTRVSTADETSAMLLHEALGAATADLAVARTLMLGHLESTEKAALLNVEHLHATSTDADLILSEIATRAYGCVNRLVEISAGSVLMSYSRLERCWRDIQLARAAEGSRRGRVFVDAGRGVLASVRTGEVTP